AAFLRARAERPAAPVVVALRRHFEEQRRGVLESGAGDADAVTRLLVNRLLHTPSEALRRAVAADPARAGALDDAVRRLCGLPADSGARDDTEVDTDAKRTEP